MNPTLGILGGGQLARMTALAAARLGIETHVFTPESNGPASQAAARTHQADYSNEAALAEFARVCDCITIDTENIPDATLRFLHPQTPVSPSPEVVAICQNRAREKTFLASKGYPVAPFRIVENTAVFKEAVEQVGPTCVLKTLEMGYDGKGQVKIEGGADLDTLWTGWSQGRQKEGIVEAWVDYQMELSVVSARKANGEMRSFPPTENRHVRHILDTSIAPARIPPDIAAQATQLAESIATDLNVTGLLAVEMFYTTRGELWINELAPRPHNSGHYTIDACATSQFEQLVRACFGLPLGDAPLLRPAVMVNLLGDLWENPKSEEDRLKRWPWVSGEPAWESILSYPGLSLHLYGKHEARPGRKMGHFCVCAATIEEALHIAQKARESL